MPDPVPPPWLVGLVTGVAFAAISVWCVIGWRLASGAAAVPRRRQRRVPWGLDGGLLAAFLLMSAAATLLVVDAEALAAPAPLRLVDSLGHTFVMFAIVCIAIGALVARAPAGRFKARDFGLTRSVTAVNDLGLGALACAALLPAVYATNYAMVALLGRPTPHPAIRALLNEPTAETIAVAALMAVVVAPLVEELAFRVLLQGGLQRYAKRFAWWPILASSLAFSMAHTNQGYAPIPIFVLAIGLGYLYRQTHSYPAVVGAHMAFNATSLAVAIGAGQAGIEF